MRRTGFYMLLCILLILFSLFLLMFGSLLSPCIVLVALFAIIFSVFFSFSLLMAPLNRKVSFAHNIPVEDKLPKVPQTLVQVRSVMNDKEFEIFSAALVIAMGEGHRFHAHSGGAGDHGVDTKLRNLHDHVVIVQSKFYAHDNHVKPTEVRDFLGALSLHDAVYGFFVTTSEFSVQALQTVRWSHGRIRIIDGRQLEVLLQHRSHEIALAWRDIRSGMPDE